MMARLAVWALVRVAVVELEWVALVPVVFVLVVVD